MYNGIGLGTVRGSGTNGFVTRNLSHVRTTKENVEYKPDEELKKLESYINKKGNAELLAHERKRKIELKCLEMEDLMSEQGYPADQVETKVAKFRQQLLDKDTKDAQQLESGEKLASTHQIAEANDLKNRKLREAFGLGEYDPASQAKQADEVRKARDEENRQMMGRKYQWVDEDNLVDNDEDYNDEAAYDAAIRSRKLSSQVVQVKSVKELADAAAAAEASFAIKREKEETKKSAKSKKSKSRKRKQESSSSSSCSSSSSSSSDSESNSESEKDRKKKKLIRSKGNKENVKAGNSDSKRKIDHGDSDKEPIYGFTKKINPSNVQRQKSISPLKQPQALNDERTDRHRHKRSPSPSRSMERYNRRNEKNTESQSSRATNRENRENEEKNPRNIKDFSTNRFNTNREVDRDRDDNYGRRGAEDRDRAPRDKDRYSNNEDNRDRRSKRYSSPSNRPTMSPKQRRNDTSRQEVKEEPVERQIPTKRYSTPPKKSSPSSRDKRDRHDDQRSKRSRSKSPGPSSNSHQREEELRTKLRQKKEEDLRDQLKRRREEISRKAVVSDKVISPKREETKATKVKKSHGSSSSSESDTSDNEDEDSSSDSSGSGSESSNSSASSKN
jgi:serine/arginine repetitive matrix protein 2